jgi:hypothetical protein
VIALARISTESYVKVPQVPRCGVERCLIGVDVLRRSGEQLCAGNTTAEGSTPAGNGFVFSR